jgi:hemerythrin-like domain-containing protein
VQLPLAPMRAVQEHTQELEAQHRDIETALFEVTHQVTDDHLATAASGFALLTRIALEHLEIEEQTLFPLLDGAVEGEAAPTAQLRRDHEHIRRMFEDVATALAIGDRQATLTGLGGLAAILGAHADREAEELYTLRTPTPPDC